VWIPFFGLLYWLTGNLLIDRNNRAKAHGTISQVVDTFKNAKSLSGCSRKVRAAAVAVCCPLKPALSTRRLPQRRLFRCVSNTSNKINLNRLNNGLVIVEMLPPVDTSQFGKEGVRAGTHCRELMAAKIEELDREVAEREAAAKK
jgi:1-acyl-sn-glycerol-3-phosphate acyltransferase